VLIILLIALAVFLADQYTKALAVSNLLEGTVPVIKDVLHLTYVENTGVAFGMFSEGNTVFAVVTIAALLAILLYFAVKKPEGILEKIGGAFIIGGAAGNLADRLLRGFVVDFIDFRIINYPVFNVADCFIVAGAIIFCAYIIFCMDKKEKENEEI